MSALQTLLANFREAADHRRSREKGTYFEELVHPVPAQ
jgi:hypothetical protein